MIDNELLKSVAETITEKPRLELAVEVKNRTWIDKLLRRPKERTFLIRPTLVGNMYRVSGKAVMLREDLLQQLGKEDGIGAMMALVNAHLEDIIYIVAVVIQNDQHEPKQSLISFIRNNFDAVDLSKVLFPVLASLNLQGFLNSIAMVKGTEGVLKPKASLKETGGMIAPGAS